jgi:hypothetical protein
VHPREPAIGLTSAQVHGNRLKLLPDSGDLPARYRLVEAAGRASESLMRLYSGTSRRGDHDQRGCPDLWRSGTRTVRTRISPRFARPGSGWEHDQDQRLRHAGKVPEELPPLLVSPAWVEDARKRWGVDSPLYKSKVDGEFPEVSENTLIPVSWITAAQERRPGAGGLWVFRRRYGPVRQSVDHGVAAQ